MPDCPFYNPAALSVSPSLPHPRVRGHSGPSIRRLVLQLQWGQWGLRLQAPPNCRPHAPFPPTPQDDSDGSIECVNEERRLHKKVCNVSYPFFRAKAKVEAEGSLGRDQGGYWGPQGGKRNGSKQRRGRGRRGGA